MAPSAGAVADGVAPALVVSETVFGGARAVGNTLMEHDGTTNFALMVGGSDATVPASEIPPDGTVVRAFLFWSGSTDPFTGVDRDVDFRLPDGTFYNDLSVDFPTAGEPVSSLNRCVSRQGVGDTPVDFYACRREVTHLLRNLGTGGATGTYTVSDVDASVGTCPPFGTDIFCQARYAGWALVVMWESPTHPVRRDLVLYDAFFAVDEQGPPFSSGISPAFPLTSFLAGPTADAEITIVGFEGDAQLGVPPQNLYPTNNPLFCDTCDDFVELWRPGGAAIRLADGNSRSGNLFNGSNSSGGGPHPGLDIDTFDIGPSGLGVLQPGDTQLFLRVGSGDGQSGGGGGGGELVFLGFTLLSLETYSPRFSNSFTEKVVLEPVAGAGETLNYILRIGNDGSATATQVVVRDQLPPGVTYVPGSTTNTCGVPSPDQGGTSPVLRPAGLNVGTLAVNERCEVRFKVTVDGGVTNGTVLSNFFTVDSAETDPLSVGPAQTEIQAAEIGQPTKRVSVVGNGAPVPGASLLYRIRVPNAGARVAPGVRVRDTLPPELAFDSFVALPAGSVNNSDEAAGVIDIGDISVPANGAAEVTFLATIRPGTTGGAVVENQASITQPSLPAPLLSDDPTTGAPVDPTRLTVQSGIDLTSSAKLVTDVDGGRAEPGDVLRYTLRLRQTGPATSTVIVTDDLPPFVESCALVSLPPGSFGGCQPGGANGTGRVEVVVPVPSGATRDVVFTVTLAAAAPDGATLVNTATLTPVEDPSRAVDVSSPAIEVFARPLFVTSTKQVADLNGGDPRPGDEVRYTITVVNTGPVAATDVEVSDAVSPRLDNVVVEDGGTLSSNTIRWTLPTLASGASAQLHFRARVALGTPNGTIVTNRALIEADAPAETYLTPPARFEVVAEPAVVVLQRVFDLNGGLFEPGDRVRYEITLRNEGDGAATSVVVREPVDPSLEDVSFPSGGRVVGNDVVFDTTSVPALASLEPGDELVLLWEASVLSPLANGTVVSEQARVTSPELPAFVVSDDPTTVGQPNDPTRFVVSSQAVLALTKTFVDLDGLPVMPGDEVELTLTVSNTGNAPATSVVVRDPLDPRLTFVSSSSGGQLVGSEVVFTAAGTPALASVLPGAPVSVRFVARVASPLANGTVIDNQASAASPDAATVPSDDPSTPAPLDPTRLHVESRPLLDGFVKTVVDLDGDGVFAPGDRVRYTLTLENTGTEAAANVVVTDPVPASLVDVTPLDGGVLTGGVVRWTGAGNAALASLGVGQPVTLRFEADIARPLANDTLVTNQATLVADGVAPVPSDDPATPADDDPTVFRVTSHPRLVVEKTVVDANGAPAEPGDVLLWTLRVRNEGGRAATGVVVTDPIDASLTAVAPQDGGSVSGGQVTWTAAGNAALASLAVDAEVVLRFSATLVSPLDNGTIVENQASAAVSEAGVPGAPWLSDDPNTPAPLDPTRVQVVSASDLTVSTLESFDESGVAIDTRRPGEVIVYELVVRNAGREVARGVEVTLPLPGELTVESAPGGTLSGGTLRYTAAGVAALAEVAPGEEVRISFEARVAFPLDDGTPLVLQAQLDEDGLVAPVVSDDPSTAALSDPTRVVVESAADLTQLAKRFQDVNGGQVEPGDEVVYFLDVRNSGDAAARDVVVRDPLPAGVDFIGSLTGGRLVGNEVVFDAAGTPALAALPPGTVELAFTVRVRADVAAGTVVSNQASAAADGLAPVPSDDPTTPGVDDDPTSFEVFTVPRVALSKTLVTTTGTRIVAPGEPLTYAFTVRSSGTAPTGALTFEDTLPGGLVDVVPGPGLSYDATTRRLSASLPSLAPGEERALTLSVRVEDDAPNGTRLENQARVDGPDVDEALSDDPDTPASLDPTVALVEAFPDLTTSTKAVTDVDGAPLRPGDLLRYTLRVANTGNGAALDVVVRDPLDTANLELVSASDGGRLVGSDVLWDRDSTPALANVAPGATVELTLEARVRGGVVDGTSIANQAALSARDMPAPVPTDDPSTPAADDPTVVVVRAPVLVFEKALVDLTGGPPLRPGDRVRYELTVRNQGSGAANDVVITDVVPGQLVDVEPHSGGASSGGVITWAAPAVPALAELSAGETVTLAFEAVVDPLTPGGAEVSNQAELSSPQLGAPLVSDDPSTGAPGDPTRRVVEADERYGGTVTLFDAETGAPIVAPVVPGQRVRAHVAFTVDGSQTGRGGVLRVPFNPLRFVLEEATAFGIIDQDNDEARWDASLNEAFRDLSPGEAIEVDVVGRVVSPIPDGAIIDVRADLTTLSSSETHTFGPARMVVASRPDLGASTKEVIDENGGLVEPGDVLTYRITVVNDGGSQAVDVLVIDPPPAGTVYVPGSATVAGVPVSDAGGASPFLTGVPLGNLDAGRSVVVTFQVRVDLHALRGFVISNQAVLRATGASDAMTDNPRTPLIPGDATVVVVGGGPTLLAQKRGAPSPAREGEPLRFEIALENPGNDLAESLVLRDLLPDTVSYVAGSATLDGTPLTDGADGDPLTVRPVGGSHELELRRDVLEAGEGALFAFDTVVLGGPVVVNQAELVASGLPLTLTDGEPSLPGAQATRIPVEGADAVLVDEGTTTLTDANGGLLEAGDPVSGRTVVHNRSAVPLELASLSINVSALFDVDEDALDARLAFDAGTRVIRLASGAALSVAPGERLSFDFAGSVNEGATDGDFVRAAAVAQVRPVGAVDTTSVDLGSASLTVGLLAGTGALAGIVFIDSEQRDGVLNPERDVRAVGFSVMAFPAGARDDEPTRSAITDEGGRFRLSPLPAGDWRVEIRSPSGALFAEHAITALEDGELREQDLRIQPSGAVYGSGDFETVRGARMFLYRDDGDGDPSNDVLVPEDELARGQQGQLTTAQGLYRFDAPPGEYRLGVEPPSALLVFPSTRLAPVSRLSSHPLGSVAELGDAATVVAHALPDEALDRSYFLRFSNSEPGWRALNNHVPLDRLQDQVRITKTANRRRLSVGDLVAYTVRVENRSAAAIPLDEGGVEIVDTLPEAFRLVDGSWRLDRIELDGAGQQRRVAEGTAGVEGKSALRFGPFALAPGAVYELRYQVVVGPGAPRGDAENRALLRAAAGQVPLSDVARARVRVEADPLFDLGSIRAKVFCDDDGDGWQDPNERGVAGARVYLDTGHYAESDITGKLHFTLVPPGMHLAKLDVATLPPGTRMRGDERQSVYLSAGLPAQVSFTARCVTDVIRAPEVILNADAFKPLVPPGPPQRTVKVEALLSSPRVKLDDVEMAVPVVDLGVAGEGEEPAFGRAPGPNLPRLAQGGALAKRLVFVPNVEAPRAVVGWQLTVQEEPDDAAPRPLYVFAGEGALPEKLAWDGRDEATGELLLAEGRRYGAVLAVVVEGGDEGMSAVRPFAVAYGDAAGPVTEPFEVALDATEGALFNAAGNPTRRLGEWARSHAPRLREQPGQIHVHAHVDARAGEAAQALTAKQAQAVADVLEKAGVPRDRITAVGEGDTKPLRPNLRERDRQRNRRVELRLVSEPTSYPPVEPRAWPAAVRVADVAVAVPEGAVTVEHAVTVAIGGALRVEVTAPSGGRVRLSRQVPEGAFDPAGDVVAGSGPAALVSGDLAGGTLRLGEREVALDVLAIGLTAPATTDDGALRLPLGEGEAVEAAFVPTGVPTTREWAVWRLRVMEDVAPVADAGADEAPARRRVVRELTGEGAPPARIVWDGKDTDGKLVVVEGASFDVRLIVETKGGDVIVAPDVVARVERGAAPRDVGQGDAAPAAAGQGGDAPGTTTEELLVVGDALDSDGGLKATAAEPLRALAEKLRTLQGTIRVTAHTDDEDGPRFTRRARTLRAAEEAKALLVAAGVDEARITALGVGSDEPRVPNLSARARRSNRRVEVELLAPPPAAPAPVVAEKAENAETPESASRAEAPAARVVANGRELSLSDGRFAGEVPATRSGEVALTIHTDRGVRALLKLRPEASEPWQGTPDALEERARARGLVDVPEASPPSEVAPETGDAESDAGPAVVDADADAGEPEPSDAVDAGDAEAPLVAEQAPLAPWTGPEGEEPPAWWPRLDQVPASVLEVELPPDGEPFRSSKLVVRGKTAPGNRVRVGAEEVTVDPETGAFEHLVTLQPGDGELVVEALDGMGNKARVRRQVSVDRSGWFTLLLADTAFGGDGALLDERTPYTSLKIGDMFLYGRGVAYVKGRWTGATLFKDYELTLHLDTGRWEEEAWARDLLNPDLVYPVFGDGSLEVQDANARFPLYFELKADTSSVRVGNVRPTLSGGDLFRYTRARYGASVELDRGWSHGIDVGGVTAAPPPAADPWRTRAGGFFTGGDTRERHARVELMGTGGAVYFLRHELVIEGSERAAVIVRDAVTGAEIARRPLARNIDYTMRYSEGRIFLMEPLPAFTDASFTVNHNLGQVSAGHRLFLEVEYDHEDAEPFMGLAGGGHVTQTLFGHLELGGGYVHEAREDGAPGYQLGGVHAKLFLDDVTWLKAEWAWSQNVDAGNFLSLDGGLSYSSLGQSLDEAPHRFGRVVFPAERQGQGYKLEGQLGFGQWLGRSSRDGLARAYFQRLTPGFFAGASIVEQGQTKWGTDGAWRITDDDTLRLRYDGVISEVPDLPQVVSETRTLHRQLATAQYQRRILPSLTGSVEYGYGYTHDSGSFGQSSFAQPRDFHTNVAALAVEWQALERLALGLKQEGILTGDPNQLLAWNDHLVTHGHVRYSLTDDLALTLTESIRWSGENQTSAGVSWRVNEEARVYANERFGFARGNFTNSTVVGGETMIAENTRAYAEYQLQSAFASDQTRGVVGISNRWKLPFGLALSLGYERVQTFGGIVTPTETGNVPPGAFTDGTFYAAPGANEGGSWFYGAGSRDAASAGIEWVRKGLFVGSQRFELRYDNFDESRGGHDRVWFLNMTNAELRLGPEIALLARVNVGLAQDLTFGRREAYLEESLVGASYRPVTHDWVSVLAKLSRRVDHRPLSLLDGRFEDYTIHAAAIEPIVELPWKLQLVEKLAIKHVSQMLDDLPRADAWTLLWINRVNWHALGTVRSLGFDPLIPGEIDLGVEYRVLAGITAARLEHGALFEVQYAPVSYFRLGVGYNFTRFSDYELARDDRDYSGFFVRGVGQF